MANLDDTEWLDPSVIGAYLTGECTPRERQVLEQWMARSPAHRAHIAELRTAWAALGKVERIDRMGHVPASVAGRALSAPPVRRIWPTRVAAAAVVLVSAGLLLWAGRREVWNARSSAATATRAIETKRGERARVTLSDGSAVVVAPETRLVYTALPHGARSVELTGEAYFEVVHDPHRPFSVRAGNAVMEDIGTHFVVRAYPSDPDVRVAVTEGAVALRANAASERSVLQGGALGVVTRAGETTVAPAAAIDAILAWRDGRLVFDRTPLQAVIEDLHRWYDLDVRLGDPELAALPVSGSLPTTSVEDALDVIGDVTGAHWARQGRTVTFFSSRGARRNP